MAVRLETSGGTSQHSSQENCKHDSPQDSDRSISERSLERSLQRGTHLLAVLAHAARAARLEAEVAELQAALAEAQAGAGRRLERWLSKFDAAGGVDAPAFESLGAWPAGSLGSDRCSLPQVPPGALPHVESYRVAVSEEGSGTLGWSPYLVHARRRLEELEHAQPHALEELGIEFGRVTIREHLAGGSIRFDRGAKQPSGTCGSPLNETLVEDAPLDDALLDDALLDDALVDNAPLDDALVDDAPLDDALVDDDIGGGDGRSADDGIDICRNGTPHDAPDRETQPAPVVTRPVLSGFGLSLLGHVALLAILFMTTIKMPGQSASLASQIVSVAAPAQDVELTPVFEALEPLEMELADVVESSSIPSSDAAPLTEIEPVAVDADSLVGAASANAQATASTGAMLSAAATSRGSAASSSGKSGRGGARGGPAMSANGGKFFGAGAGGNFFCYVVDSSGSMRGAAWESAKAELIRSIGTLSEKQRFYIVFFAKEVAAIPEPGGREPASHGLAATKENIDHARRWIETVKLDRGGPPNEALEWAISREPDAIYLLTDGVTQVDVCAFLRKANRTSDIISGEQVRVPIHAIAYHSLDGQQLLRQLAQENAGQFHYVPAPK